MGYAVWIIGYLLIGGGIAGAMGSIALEKEKQTLGPASMVFMVLLWPLFIAMCIGSLCVHTLNQIFD